jgi:predicted amidophosphoribosyltransferase
VQPRHHHGPVLTDWLDDWCDLALGGACVSCTRPGRLLCAECRAALPDDAHRVLPEPCPAGLARAFAAAEYADPVRRMILLHKERRVFALARPLGLTLVAPVRAGLVPRGRTLLVPVPSRPAVVRERGHDPMLRIARVTASALRATGADVVVCPLLRQRDVVADQAGLTARERAVNLAGRMAVRPSRLHSIARSGVPVTVVVCDDVLTTGSTAREAQRALEDVGLRVAAIGCVAATRRRVPLPLSGGCR